MQITSISRRATCVIFGLVLLVGGCDRVKSSTPLSPSLAGPIAGVTIKAPSVVEPAAGRVYRDTEQPLTFVFGNAESNSVRPYAMTLEVGTDAKFSVTVFRQTGIEPNAEGVNRLLLPSKLQAGREYHWRVMADDGANSSDWSPATVFAILKPIVIGRPEPLWPIGGARVLTNTPTLRVSNGASSGPHGPLFYQFQASTSPAFTGLVGNQSVPEGPGETTVLVPASPGPDMLVYWRARISDEAGNQGDWSRTESYRTPLAGTAPAPAPSPGSGSTGSPTTCASKDGSAIVACIEATYPSYLAAGVSSSQREANMEFLRDRIIEAGICGGLDLAWNKKRGTGPHSIDALAWRTGSGDEVVDIGQAYDDTSRVLRLQWGIVAGPPGYDPYSPRPSCQ